MHSITEQRIREFENCLIEEEKAVATRRKYLRAVRSFEDWMDGREITKKLLLEYREHIFLGKSAQTVNGELAAIHSYLDFCGLSSQKVKFLKVQRKSFADESRELSETEYKRLLNTASRRGNERLCLVMMSICSTGIRVSELRFITAEAVKCGRAEIRMKGKCRTILLPKELCKKLEVYMKSRDITKGSVFRTKGGNPLDRSNISHDMKKLCQDAGVDPKKVFPHNLRHLFARTFIAIENNIAHLADILGHSRIETTRIYVSVSAKTHKRILGKMHLVI